MTTSQEAMDHFMTYVLTLFRMALPDCKRRMLQHLRTKHLRLFPRVTQPMSCEVLLLFFARLISFISTNYKSAIRSLRPDGAPLNTKFSATRESRLCVAARDILV